MSLLSNFEFKQSGLEPRNSNSKGACVSHNIPSNWLIRIPPIPLWNLEPGLLLQQHIIDLSHVLQ